MSIVSCPKCADSVAMPAGASPAATVRCPLCQEQFQLSELLESLPPALIVVEDPEAAESGAPDTLFFADSTSDRPINLLDEVETASPSGAFAIESRGDSAASSSAPSPGKRRRAAPRPQGRKKKSPAMEIVKVFLGGIAGLVIAQAILWWLPWTKYRRDPFELGPKVSSFAGWMVPEQFHGKGKAKPAESNDTGPTANSSNSAQMDGQPIGVVGAGGAADTGLPQRTFVDPNQTPEDVQPPKVPDDEAGDKGNGSKKQGGAQAAPKDAGVAEVPVDNSKQMGGIFGQAGAGSDLAAPGESGGDLEVAGMSVDPLNDLNLDADLLNMMDPAGEPTLADPGNEASVGGRVNDASPVARIVNVPVVSDAELRTAVDEANAVAKAWATAENPGDQPLIAQSYQALAKLAEAVTFAEDIRGEQKQAVSDLLSSLLSNPERVGNLKTVGPRWPAYTKREGTGILLVGTVIGTQQDGDLYVIQLQVGEGNAMAVYHDADPAADWPPGESIVVLGAIVDDPRNTVSGYAGDSATLIWLGLAQVLEDD